MKNIETEFFRGDINASTYMEYMDCGVSLTFSDAVVEGNTSGIVRIRDGEEREIDIKPKIISFYDPELIISSTCKTTDEFVQRTGFERWVRPPIISDDLKRELDNLDFVKYVDDGYIRINYNPNMPKGDTRQSYPGCNDIGRNPNIPCLI